MCGIAGFIAYRGRCPDEHALTEAGARLSHRGPDDRDQFIGGDHAFRIGLVHTRLAVIDPSPLGRQPMTDDSERYVITFNGEIYNYVELRRELECCGVVFQTHTDTEVVLRGYAQWGSDVFARLNGMWAIAIVDREERCGVLCRDRYGIKPLLYSLHEGQLTFASELRSLLVLSNAPHSIRAESLQHYLTYGYIAHPWTIYDHCFKLPPGAMIQFSADGIQSPTQYYHVQEHLDAEGDLSPQRVVDALSSSVKARMVSDVPLGAFLSGGLDSSIVVAHLSRHSTRAVQTFSIGYKDQPRYDETRHAHAVAKHCGSEHHCLMVGFNDVITHLPTVLDHLGEPFADASLIPTSLVSRFARKQVTVVMSGDGADELFGGYYRYQAHHVLERWQRIPAAIRNAVITPALSLIRSSKSSGFSNRVRQLNKLLRAEDADPISRHLLWSRILDPDALEVPHHALLSPAVVRAALGERLYDYWGSDPLNQIMSFDLGYQLPNDMLHKVDTASMMHGLEVRVPFLDPAVVGLAARMPSSMKCTRHARKKVLGDAHGSMLPASVIARSKMGFELPIGEFLRCELRSMFHDTVTASCLADLGIDHASVTLLYDQHNRREAEHADALYALLVLCWWHGRCR